MTSKALCGLAVVLALTTACGSHPSLRGTGPHPIDSAPRDGLRYFLGRDLVAIDADVTYRREVGWVAIPVENPDVRRARLKLGNVRPCKLEPKTPLWLTTAWRVSLVPAADRSQVFRLGILPDKSSDNGLNVTVGENGLLTSLNYSREDRTADIVTNILKGVAGIAGAVVGIPSLTPSFDLNKIDLTQDPGLDSTQKEFVPSDNYCYAESRPDAAALALEIDRLSAQLGTLLNEQDVALARARTAKTSAEVTVIREVDSLFSRRVANLTQRLEAARTSFAAGASRFVISQGVGRRDSTERISDVLNPEELPKSLTSELRAQVENQLGDSRSRRLLQQAHLVLTLETPTATGSVSGTPTASADTGSLGCADAARMDACARIFYRQPPMRTLRVHVADTGAATALLRVRETRTVGLAMTGDPWMSLGFEPKRIGNGSVKLTFGRVGEVRGLEQASTSTLAEGASGFAGGLAAARTEFNAGLTAVATAQTTVSQIEQTARTNRIKALQDRKTQIDAEIAAQGADANRNLKLEKERLEAELALLNAKDILAGAQEKSATATEVAALRAQIDELRAQIDLMKVQAELEQARRDLEKAKTGS